MQAIDGSSLSSLGTLLRSIGMDEDGTLLRAMEFGTFRACLWLALGSLEACKVIL